ncbi:MAG: rRNA maturation RNase YbeY [Defluviitaleaceae bacterium]|nr:rRNA maturation RNase YbeY [Defluviitaleaceae bacterium]
MSHPLYPKYKKLAQKAFFATLQQEGIVFSVGVSARMVGDLRMREINKEKRGKDATTDVLSFPMLGRADILRANHPEVHVNLGDIVVNLEKAHQQAREYGHSMEREVAFLTVHATLHLLGYDHDTKEAEEDMKRRQEAVLEGMGLIR